MCVVSMVMDHQWDKWRRTYPVQPGQINPWPRPILPREPPQIPFPPCILPNGPTPQEIDEFRELLERAREYDKRNNEPHCEMAEKKEKLKALAKELGVDISFVDEE